ncbi:MAG: UbiX family flavin prenyltransferase [Bacillota bacterium]
MSTFVVGITGASGAPYARRLLEVLKTGGHHLMLTISEAGRRVLAEETGCFLDGNVGSDGDKIRQFLGYGPQEPGLDYYDIRDVGAAMASGSIRTDGMIIIPCSMATVSAVAAGASRNLLERAADVTIKEGRRLIVVPRETPLSRIHLRNLLTLAEAGVSVVPAMPAFYNDPRSVEDIVDFLVGKVLDLLGLDHSLYRRWEGTGAHKG